MPSYKKQFLTLLNNNASQQQYSSTGLTSLPSYAYSQQDDPGDIRVEPDNQTESTVIPVGGNTTGQLVGHRSFRFANLTTASANCTAGNVTFLADVFGTIATTVSASSVGSFNAVCGVAVANVTAGNYGWWQIRGWHAGVSTTGFAAAAGGLLTGNNTNATSAGVVAQGVAPTQVVIGVAVAAASGNATAARLCIPE